MKTYFRVILTFVVVLFALLVTALSCDKKDDAGNTAGNQLVTNLTNVTNVTQVNNVTQVTNFNKVTNLTTNTNIVTNIDIVNEAKGFEIIVNSTYAKLIGTTIYINAKKLADAVGPAISDANVANRGAGKVADVAFAGPNAINVPNIFTVSIRNSTAGIMLVQPDAVTKHTLEYKTAATTTGYPAALNTAPVATATYRTYDLAKAGDPAAGPFVWNVFGDFKNTDVDGAQGVFYCRSYLYKSGSPVPPAAVSSAANPDGPLVGGQTMDCRFASINNAVNATAEIDEDWVDLTTTTKTLDLKLFGIDTGAKEIFELGAGFANSKDFEKPVPKEAMKKIIDANVYSEAPRKIEIVKEAKYLTLKTK